MRTFSYAGTMLGMAASNLHDLPPFSCEVPMARSALQIVFLAWFLLAIGCTSEPTGDPVSRGGSEESTPTVNAQPVRVDVDDTQPSAEPDIDAVEHAEVSDAEGASAPVGGSGGAPAPPPPELITREEYLALVARRVSARLRRNRAKCRLLASRPEDPDRADCPRSPSSCR